MDYIINYILKKKIKKSVHIKLYVQTSVASSREKNISVYKHTHTSLSCLVTTALHSLCSIATCRLFETIISDMYFILKVVTGSVLPHGLLCLTVVSGGAACSGSRQSAGLDCCGNERKSAALTCSSPVYRPMPSSVYRTGGSNYQNLALLPG